MIQERKASIKRLPTGVPGLDLVLGGGLPEYSFTLIAGEPGTGKTTLAQQFLFENATPERTALYFTVLGEPAVKMLRYQQQFTFFDSRKVDESIRFVNLTDDALERGLEGVLERIVQEVKESGAAFVVVDSSARSSGPQTPGPSPLLPSSRSSWNASPSISPPGR